MKKFTFRPVLAGALAVSCLLLGGCSVLEGVGGSKASGTHITGASAVIDQTQIHEIELAIEDDALTGMIQEYLDSGEKTWIQGTVTIDGEKYDNVGIKLKGNSTLREITADTSAQELPLRIRLDKYVDGQQHEGVSDLTVRANSSETSLNEAVALDLLNEVGLASTLAIATRFTVNGGESALRLTVQNLDGVWAEEHFGDTGAESMLYKAKADGDWTWKGDDGDYTSSFGIEAGEDSYQPLIELLDLVNNGSAEEVSAELPELLDIDAFATYLAFEETIDNFDDIDGPGNNSYLYWDAEAGQFTVVAWDHNLAFGGMPFGGGGANGEFGAGGAPGVPPAGGADGLPEGFPEGAPEGFSEDEIPEGFPESFPEGFPGGARGEAPGGAGRGSDTDGTDSEGGIGGMDPSEMSGIGGGGMGLMQDNPLVDVFKANAEWSALYDDRVDELYESLVEGGSIEKTVTQWADMLTAGASDLVPADTIAEEAEAILENATAKTKDATGDSGRSGSHKKGASEDTAGARDTQQSTTEKVDS